MVTMRHIGLARDLIIARSGKERIFSDGIQSHVENILKQSKRRPRRIVISDSEEEEHEEEYAETPSQGVETLDSDEEDSPAVLLSESAECAMCDGLAQV